MTTTSLLMMTITSMLLLLLLTSPVNMSPVHFDVGNTNNVTMTTTHSPNPVQNFSLSRFTTAVSNLLSAWQTIVIVVKEHEEVAPHEYCFIKDIFNIQTANATIEERLLLDYHVLQEITLPLRDVVNYEAHIDNHSDVHNKLVWVLTQINSSLEELQDIQSSGQPSHKVPTKRQQPISIDNHSPVVNTTVDNHSSVVNTTQFQGHCVDGVVNAFDEFRDLMEIQIGFTVALQDLRDIQRTLDPHQNSS